MQTIAQKKARINGWIKTYEDRMKSYVEKYGYDSIESRIQCQRCRYRIRLWKQQLDRLNNSKFIVKQNVVQRVLEFTETYFEKKLKDEKGYTLNNSPIKHYISKFIVDNGLLSKHTASIIKTTTRETYKRRDKLTENKDHKNNYRAYRLTIEAQLLANKIQYK